VLTTPGSLSVSGEVAASRENRKQNGANNHLHRRTNPECRLQQRRRELMRLFVGNLHFGTVEDDIKAWFAERDWHVTDVRIATDKNTGQSRGFAFAEAEGGQNCIKDMDGQQLHGRRINVSEARPRPPQEQRTQPGRQRKRWMQQDNRYGQQD